MERRAVEWLADEGLLDSQTARDALAERHDPDVPSAVRVAPHAPVVSGRECLELRRRTGSTAEQRA
jgi:hypothetical protein